MGILNSDIGYQIGLLAGGLWAERYRQRGEEKKANENKDTSVLRSPSYEADEHLTVNGIRPADFSISNDHRSITANPYLADQQFTITVPYTFTSQLLDQRAQLLNRR